jgi:hypothetical protein
VISLTPRLGSVAMNEKMLDPVEKCYHSFFHKLEGNHPLAGIVAERFNNVWGKP